MDEVKKYWKGEPLWKWILNVLDLRDNDLVKMIPDEDKRKLGVEVNNKNKYSKKFNYWVYITHFGDFNKNFMELMDGMTFKNFASIDNFNFEEGDVFELEG